MAEQGAGVQSMDGLDLAVAPGVVFLHQNRGRTNRQDVMMKRIFCFISVLGIWMGVLRAQVLDIADARQQPPGSVVTVSGVVTVAQQFGNPAFIQDRTAGIAVYDFDFIQQVQIGDSVVVRGTLSEFGQQNGQLGSGLLELTDVILLQKVSGAQIDTLAVSLAAIDETIEGRLVRIDSVFWTLLRDDFFPAESRNYGIFDPTGAGEIRVDNNTELGGKRIPHTPFDLIGVVSQYRGQYQIMPRFVTDLQPLPPQQAVPDSQRLTLVTWNLEWFGDPNREPSDDAAQFAGVYALIDSVNADIYLLQEVANPTVFQQLADSLARYDGYLAPYDQELRTGYLVKRSEITVLDTNLLFTAAPSDAWAWGRYPFHLVFRWRGVRLHVLNLHMKSGTNLEDQQLRWRDAMILYNGLSSRWRDSLLIVGGDWNDDFDESIVPGAPSPYEAFVADSGNFIVPDYWLSVRGVGTHRGGSFLDHFVMMGVMRTLPIQWQAGVVLPSSVERSFATVSDHLPLQLELVWQPSTVVPEREAAKIRVLHKQLLLGRPATIRIYTLWGQHIGTWRRVYRVDLSFLPPQPVVYVLNGRQRGILMVR